MSYKVALNGRLRLRTKDEVLGTSIEPLKPCVKRQATFPECIKYGISPDKARTMRPEELTQFDVFFLLNHGVSVETISKVYQLV